MKKSPTPNFSMDRLEKDIEKRIQEIEQKSNGSYWTPREDMVLAKCYGRINIPQVRKEFLPHRSVDAIDKRIKRLRWNGDTRFEVKKHRLGHNIK